VEDEGTVEYEEIEIPESVDEALRTMAELEVLRGHLDSCQCHLHVEAIGKARGYMDLKPLYKEELKWS
jgi:hypothetical protein